MQEMSPEKEKEETTRAETEEQSEEIAEVEVVDSEMVDDDEEDEDDDDDEDLDEQEARVQELEEENQALRTRVLRAHADMENAKKRFEREKLEAIKFANKNLFLQILDVLDNFDRALMAVTDPKDNFVIGVNMIHKQLMDVLNQNGVEEINAMGRLFDPYLDEALAREETSEHPENTVTEVFMKGYRYQGNLLRPTKVKVAVPATEATETAENESTDEESQEA